VVRYAVVLLWVSLLRCNSHLAIKSAKAPHKTGHDSRLGSASVL